MKKCLNKNSKSGFKVPDSYFETFQVNKFDEHQPNFKIEESGYLMPNNYLSEITGENILKNNKKPYNTSFFKRKTYAYISGLAASILICVGVYNLNTKLSFNTIDISLVEMYLYDNDVYTDEVASLYSVENLMESDFIDSSISDEMLEEFILSEDDFEVLMYEN